MSQQTGVRDQVLAIVAKRWPCMEVPRGGLSELAAEVGVSRERVRQIVRAEGIGKRLKGPPPPRPCKWCGLPVLRKNYRYCAACSAIPCICETCGKAFTTNVTRIKHLQRMPRAITGVPIFCSRACWRPRGKAAGSTVTATCEYCGKQWIAYASKAARTCSRECGQRLRRGWPKPEAAS